MSALSPVMLPNATEIVRGHKDRQIDDRNINKVEHFARDGKW